MVSVNSGVMMNHNQAQRSLALTMMQLSSGDRIFRAGQDAAGLAISEGMRSQIRGDSMAIRNMADSQSLARVAEGALAQTQNSLHRMRELAVQANNGMLTASDRGALQQEFNQLREHIDFVGEHTEFNTQRLLDGSFTDRQTTTNANGDTVSFDIDAALSENLGSLEEGVTLRDLDLADNPAQALSVIDDALGQISSSRGSIGAFDNRLSYAGNVAQNQLLNMQRSESGIRDADMALNIMDMNRMTTMLQASMSVQSMQMGMMGMHLDLLR